MSDQNGSQDQEIRAQASWAAPVAKLKVSDLPSGAMALNIEGHQVLSPLQGFGRMWQRNYRVRLEGIAATPAEVVRDWKTNFAVFQPPQNQFYPTLSGIKPGEMVFINTKLPLGPGMPGLIPMKSGVMILYADDEQFTVMTPEGFPISGWNTFSAYEEDGCTVAQVQGLIRASDPIYEFGFRFMGGEKEEDKTWYAVLENLAAHWGVKGQVQFQKTLIDPKMQWKYAGNAWKNAAIRTFFYVLATPFRWLLNLGKARG
jgi:hypothetical protein